MPLFSYSRELEIRGFGEYFGIYVFEYVYEYVYDYSSLFLSFGNWFKKFCKLMAFSSASGITSPILISLHTSQSSSS